MRNCNVMSLLKHIRQDSLEDDKKERSGVLALIKVDKLDRAIERITSAKYNTLFSRRLKRLEKNSRLGILSFE